VVKFAQTLMSTVGDAVLSFVHFMSAPSAFRFAKSNCDWLSRQKIDSNRFVQFDSTVRRTRQPKTSTINKYGKKNSGIEIMISCL